MNLKTFFKGRIDRLYFLLGVLTLGLVGALINLAVTALVGLVADSVFSMYFFIGLTIAVYLIYIVFFASLSIRRLHDLNQSGWWTLLMLVPLVNAGLLIYLCYWRGDVSENQYGDRPPRDRNLRDALLNRDYTAQPPTRVESATDPE